MRHRRERDEETRMGRPELWRPKTIHAVLVAFFAAALVSPPIGFCQDQAQPPEETKKESSFQVRGYVKSFSVAFQPARPEGAPEPALMGAVNNRLRLKFDWTPAKNFSIQAAYDVSPRIQDPTLFAGSAFGFQLDATAYRLTDLRERLLPRPGGPLGSVGVYQNLDRLFLSLKTKWGDISVGRQPVAWGSARVVNPTDIIAPFSFNELDKEERYGVDAVRWRVPLGTMSEIDAGYVFGRRFAFDKSAFYLKARAPLLGMDVTALGLVFRENALIGLDVAGSIGGAGAWLEAAAVIPDALAPSDTTRPAEKSYYRLSAGLDGSPSNRIYGFLEYHFNSAGAPSPESYLERFSHVAYTRGSVYLMGRHYAAVGLSYQLHSLVPVTGLVLWNIADGSAALFPQAEYNAAENIYLAAGALLRIGQSPSLSSDLKAADSPLQLRSEFGFYANFAYFAFRYYF